jgi:pimeloyl-ACP methyl ester carboxylesterase
MPGSEPVPPHIAPAAQKDLELYAEVSANAEGSARDQRGKPQSLKTSRLARRLRLRHAMQTKPSIVFVHRIWATALAPDTGETSQSQQDQFATTDIFSHIEVAEGRVWMLPQGVACFAGDLSDQEQKLVWATQFAPAVDLFNQELDGTAWSSKPSWYIVANKDRTVQPELQGFVAKRMGAAVFEVESSHVPMLSNPGFVIDVISAAAQTVQGSRVKASR